MKGSHIFSPAIRPCFYLYDLSDFYISLLHFSNRIYTYIAFPIQMSSMYLFNCFFSLFSSSNSSNICLSYVPVIRTVSFHSRLCLFCSDWGRKRRSTLHFSLNSDSCVYVQLPFLENTRSLFIPSISLLPDSMAFSLHPGKFSTDSDGLTVSFTYYPTVSYSNPLQSPHRLM